MADHAQPHLGTPAVVEIVEGGLQLGRGMFLNLFEKCRTGYVDVVSVVVVFAVVHEQAEQKLERRCRIDVK